jgi:hypothetical protein
MQSTQVNQASTDNRRALPWLLLVIVSLLAPLAPGYDFPPLIDSWPVLAGIVIAAVLIKKRPAFLDRLTGRIPPGDMIVIFHWLYCQLRRVLSALIDSLEQIMSLGKGNEPNRLRLPRSMNTGKAEKVLSLWQISGIIFMAICIILVITLLPMK